MHGRGFESMNFLCKQRSFRFEIARPGLHFVEMKDHLAMLVGRALQAVVERLDFAAQRQNLGLVVPVALPHFSGEPGSVFVRLA